jgi:hypothetical protein
MRRVEEQSTVWWSVAAWNKDVREKIWLCACLAGGGLEVVFVWEKRTE